jgi:hypothetical protein
MNASRSQGRALKDVSWSDTGRIDTQLGPGWLPEVTAVAVLALAGSSSIEEIMTILPIGLPQTAEGFPVLAFLSPACMRTVRENTHTLSGRLSTD